MGHALLIQPAVASVELLWQLHQGLLPPIDLCLMLTGVDILHIGSLFNPEQVVGSDCHPAHFEGDVVLIKSEILLCSDGFVVASSHWLVSTADLLQLGISPESLFSRTAEGPHILAEPLAGGLYDFLLGVQSWEAIIPSFWIRARVSRALPWVTVWVALIGWCP